LPKQGGWTKMSSNYGMCMNCGLTSLTNPGTILR
jgi:hypothetical protein